MSCDRVARLHPDHWRLTRELRLAALLDAAAHWARAEGSETLSLEVMPADIAASKLYHAKGFRPDARPVTCEGAETVLSLPLSA